MTNTEQSTPDTAEATVSLCGIPHRVSCNLVTDTHPRWCTCDMRERVGPLLVAALEKRADVDQAAAVLLSYHTGQGSTDALSPEQHCRNQAARLAAAGLLPVGADRVRRIAAAVQATLTSLEEDHERVAEQLRHRNREYGLASQEVGSLRARLTHAHQQRYQLTLNNGLLVDQLSQVRHLLKHFGEVAETESGWTSRCWICGRVEHGWTSDTAAWVHLDHHWKEEPAGSCGYVRLWTPGDRVQWTTKDGLRKGAVVGPAGKHHVEVREDGVRVGTHLIPPDHLDAELAEAATDGDGDG